VLVYALVDPEVALGVEPHDLLRRLHLLLAERRPVRGRRIDGVRRRIGDVGADRDERRPLDLLARLSDEDLANVIYQYGDERRARRVARSLKKALATGELRTTLDLRRAIVRAVGPARIGGVDPATRTFQALRIAVNSELIELERLLATLAETVIGLYKTELIRRRGPWRTAEQVELATAEWVD